MDAINSRRNYIVLFGGILIALLFYPAGTYLVFYYQKNTFATLFYHYLFMWLGVLVLYVYALRMEASSLLIWPEKRYKILFYILSILVLCVLYLTGNIIATIPKWLGWHESLDSHYTMKYIKKTVNDFLQNFTLWILLTISWSITSELVFRGYLLPRLSVLFKNKGIAIIISSLLFAIFPYGHSLFKLISYFISGVFFAIFYQKYSNLKILIISRILIDLILMLLLRRSFLWVKL